MSQSLKTLLKVSAFAAAFGLLAGCASDPSLQASVDEATQKAEAAQATADEAKATAEAAMAAANEAKEMASNAQGVARAAQFQADRNSRKMDEMFQKSMQK